MAGNFLFGTPSRIETRSPYEIPQQKAFADLLKMGQRNLQNPLAGFESVKNRANQRFSQETVPALMERFNALGSNALSSPALMSQLSQAGGTLQERLAGLENEYQQGRENLGLQQTRLGLTPQSEAYQLGGEEGIGQPLLAGAGAVAPYALSHLYSNYGTGKGGDISGILSSLGGLLGNAGGAAAGLGTLGTAGAGAVGAAGLYGLYKLLSYLTSGQNQNIPGQQNPQQSPWRNF